MEGTFIALAIVILLFSVILHEVMHGLAALYFGDHTAENAGRLTLNPIPHIDPIGTILVPALFLLPALFGGGTGFIVGWAKPVPVNPLNFSNIRRGELVVALAGVAANFAVAIIAAILFHLVPLSLMQAGGIPFLDVLSFTVTINLILGVFNLIPIPPLDGSKVVLSQLPYKLARQYEHLERYGFMIILFLWFFPIPGTGIPILSYIISFLVGSFSLLLRVPSKLFS